MSFAVGIGAGIAIGIATGVAAGQKRARDNISSYVKSNNMTIQNDKGQTLSVEEFLEASSRVDFERNRGPLVLGIVIGVLLLVLVVGIVLFLRL
jgi:preprotein translocase subunit SecY